MVLCYDILKRFPVGTAKSIQSIRESPPLTVQSKNGADGGHLLHTGFWILGLKACYRRASNATHNLCVISFNFYETWPKDPLLQIYPAKTCQLFRKPASVKNTVWQWLTSKKHSVNQASLCFYSSKIKLSWEVLWECFVCRCQLP